jgi:hypothetical protein
VCLADTSDSLGYRYRQYYIEYKTVAQGIYWYLYHFNEKINGGLASTVDAANSSAAWSANRHLFDKPHSYEADSSGEPEFYYPAEQGR